MTLWMKCGVNCLYDDTGEHDADCEPQTTLDNANLVGLVNTAEAVRPHHDSIGGLSPEYVSVNPPRGWDEPDEPEF